MRATVHRKETDLWTELITQARLASGHHSDSGHWLSVGQAREQTGKAALTKEAPKQVWWEFNALERRFHPQCPFKHECSSGRGRRGGRGTSEYLLLQKWRTYEWMEVVGNE